MTKAQTEHQAEAAWQPLPTEIVAQTPKRARTHPWRRPFAREAVKRWRRKNPAEARCVSKRFLREQ